MAHVPNFVKLAGHKGRSDLPVEAAQGDAILTWVTTDAELESDSDQNIHSLADKLQALKSSGQPVELELMELETDIKPEDEAPREWTDTAEQRVTVEDVRLDGRELVVDLRIRQR